MSTIREITVRGQAVGEIDLATGVYSCRRHSSKHLLRQPKGWAFDLTLLRDLGARALRVFDWDSGVTYSTTLDAAFRHGITIDRGHGRQIVLQLTHWQRDDDEPAHDQGEPAPARQMPLFEVSNAQP